MAINDEWELVESDSEPDVGLVDYDDEMLVATTERVKVQVAMDSGAVAHVINPGDASGIQRLTMCEFIVTVTCEQCTVPIVYEEEM